MGTRRESITGLLHLTPIVRQLPLIVPITIELPMWLIRLISSDAALVIQILRVSLQRPYLSSISRSLQAARRCKNRQKLPSESLKNVSDTKLEEGHANLMQAMLRSRLPPREKTRNRIAKEAFSVLTASGDTTASTLTKGAYHLLANPQPLSRLREELATIMPGPRADVESRQLESLPWFVSAAQMYGI